MYASVQFLRQWPDEEAPQVFVAVGDTTKCESGLSALMTEWKASPAQAAAGVNHLHPRER